MRPLPQAVRTSTAPGEFYTPYEEAKASGAGATAVDGKMVDGASVRLAQVTSMSRL